MIDSASVRMGQLAVEVAMLIATDDDPAVARQKFDDKVTKELLLGPVNLAGSQWLVEAFRDAMGYSVRVAPEDVLGERDGVPSAPPMVQADPIGSSRSPSAFRVVEGGDA